MKITTLTNKASELVREAYDQGILDTAEPIMSRLSGGWTCSWTLPTKTVRVTLDLDNLHRSRVAVDTIEDVEGHPVYRGCSSFHKTNHTRHKTYELLSSSPQWGEHVITAMKHHLASIRKELNQACAKE